MRVVVAVWRVRDVRELLASRGGYRSGMPLNHHAPKVVTQKGQKKVRVRTTGDKSQITIVGCPSASGQVIPLHVIFDTATLNVAWTEGEVPRIQYGLSKTKSCFIIG